MKLLVLAATMCLVSTAQTPDYGRTFKNTITAKGVNNILSDAYYAANGFSFAAMCTAAVGLGQPISLTATWTAVAAQTCAAKLIPVAGAMIQPASGAAVLLTGWPSTAPLQKFFDLSAGGTISGLASQVVPQWWGAVADYNAVADTGTDSTLAVQQAFAAAVSSAVSLNISGWTGAGSTLYFPQGRYLISTAAANALTPALGGVRGVNFRGAGMWDSVIYLKGSASYYFLYNDDKLAFFGFEDLGVVGVTGAEKLMYYNSTGTAQNIRRKGVHTYNLAQLYNIQGTGNADVNTHSDCDDVHLSTTVPFILVNNSQSVVHTFYNVHVVEYFHYLEFTAGGSVFWYGGQILMNGSSKLLYINDSGGTGVGSGNGQFVFSAIKTELRGTAGLLYSNSAARVTFRDSHMRVRAADPVAFELKQGRLNILDSDFDYIIQVDADDSTYSMSNPPEVVVRGCDLSRPPETLYTDSFVGSNVGGKGKPVFQNNTMPQGIGSYPANLRRPVNSNPNYKLGWSSLARTESVMVYQAVPDGRGLPNTTAATFTLPKNSIVTRVLLVNSAAVAKQWTLTGPSGSVWLTSVLSQKMNAATVFEEIGSTTTLTLTNITDNNWGDGYVMVWYI